MNLVDVHFHAIPNCYRKAAIAADKLPPVSGGLPDWSPELAQEVMDRNGIDVAVLSISPGVYFGDDTAARLLARECNEALASCLRDNPRRFGAFAAVPLPDIEGSLAEISRGFDEFGLDGVGLFARYGERYLGDSVFDPVMELLDERKAVAFVHPASAQTKPGSLPTFALEYPFETTRAAANLIFSRAVERFPNIRFILAHAGGTLPYLSTRLAACPTIDDRRFGEFSAESIASAIRHFWFDTALSNGPATFATLRHVVEPDRVLFGSDWPYAPERVTTESVAALTVPGSLSEQESAALHFQNSLKLFPRLNAGLGAAVF